MWTKIKDTLTLALWSIIVAGLMLLFCATIAPPGTMTIPGVTITYKH